MLSLSSALLLAEIVPTGQMQCLIIIGARFYSGVLSHASCSYIAVGEGIALLQKNNIGATKIIDEQVSENLRPMEHADLQSLQSDMMLSTVAETRLPTLFASKL